MVSWPQTNPSVSWLRPATPGNDDSPAPYLWKIAHGRKKTKSLAGQTELPAEAYLAFTNKLIEVLGGKWKNFDPYRLSENSRCALVHGCWLANEQTASVVEEEKSIWSSCLRRHAGLRQWLLGSVTDQVTRLSSYPVLSIAEQLTSKPLARQSHAGTFPVYAPKTASRKDIANANKLSVGR